MKLNLAMVCVSGAWMCFTVSAQQAEPKSPPAKPDAREVLEKARAAAGLNSEARRAGVLLKGTTNLMGLDSEAEVLTDGDGRFVISRRGRLNGKSGFDGKTVWVHEISGERHVAEFVDREDLFLGGGLITGTLLREDSGMNYEGDEEYTTDEVVSLLFSRSDGRITGRVEFDRSTWLATGWTATIGPTIATWDLTGVLELGGAKFPKKIEAAYSNGIEVVTEFRGIEAAPQFVRDPYEPELGVPDDFTFAAGESGVLEVKRVRTGHLLVKPKINGEDAGWFIFDTGAGICVLSNTLVDDRKIERFGRIAASGVGGSVPTTLAKATMTLGPLTIRDMTCITLDLSMLDGFLGESIAGLIGYNVLARSVTEFDAAAGKITIHDAKDYRLPRGEWMPLTVSSRTPHIPAEFEGKRGVFKLDSGAAQMFATFHQPTVKRYGLLNGRETTQTRLGGVGGSVPAQSGVLKEFVLGGKTFNDVNVTFAEKPVGVFADPFSCGNLGSKALSSFVVVLDYQGRRVALLERPDAEGGPVPEAKQ